MEQEFQLGSATEDLLVDLSASDPGVLDLRRR